MKTLGHSMMFDRKNKENWTLGQLNMGGTGKII